MKLRRLIASTLAATSLPEVLLRWRARSRVLVLGYHRVMPAPSADYPFNETVFSATPDEFARELKFLRDNTDVISIPELLKGLQDSSLLPPRPSVITFDDGYVDNYTHAFPLLREAGLPACFFICTGLIGTRTIPWYEAWVCCLKRSAVRHFESPFGGEDPPYDLDPAHRTASFRRFRRLIRGVPWAELPALLARLRELTRVNPEDHLTEPMFMSWDQVREMSVAGMEIGGHTRTHPILSTVRDPAMLADEVSGCFDDLTRIIGRSPLAFAYPWGHRDAMSPEADAQIKRAGFTLSFSFMHGFASRGGMTARLPRVHVYHGDDYRAFRLGVSTAPDLGSLAGSST
jgi:peptidoglycan/xylan/chitin deacetylase (PgdA/CDA1 family)